MSDNQEHSNSRNRRKQFQKLQATTSKRQQQSQADDDDSGGGGPGKRKQKGLGLEKLLSAIAKGKKSAKAFWRFLNKEGLDVSDTKKSELQKISEKSEKDPDKKDSQKSKEELNKLKERLQELEQEHSEHTSEADSTYDDQPAWDKSKSKTETKKGKVFRDNIPNADAIGSLFVKHEQTAGAIDARAAAQSSADMQGGRVQGAQHAKHQDYHGSMQFNHYGKDAIQFALSKNAKVNATTNKVSTQKPSSEPQTRSTIKTSR